MRTRTWRSGSYVPLDLFDSPDQDAPTFSLDLTSFVPSHPSGAGTSYVPPDPFKSPDADYVHPPPSTGGTSYAPPPPSAVGLSFDAPPPPGTAGSSVPHMTISHASSSDSDEHGDDPKDYVTPAQQLGFGHRVRSSGELLDDLIESDTIRLLDWNNAMTDLQLRMRFVDKIQAISTVQKWSNWIRRGFRVGKSKSD
ncbi:hypothetical protein M9H77_03055 [Catharanthus roseus]|uniref:Uncharacterized protein n=1 Tax=Catharanthus roseus TaxID=4058 RepID=A0ACC0CAB5_CATRO|nr:hypothetical protein M9H77_03055 [Catharanthus roseus]